MQLNHTVDALVNYAKGKSVLNQATIREGVVIRPLIERKDPTLGRWSFKVINPEFLLKEAADEDKEIKEPPLKAA